MKEKLQNKLKMYQDMKRTVLENDYDIDRKVEEYREALVKECEKDRARKVEKIDTYIELLNALIAEESEEADVKEDIEEVETAEVDQAVVENVNEEM